MYCIGTYICIYRNKVTRYVFSIKTHQYYCLVLSNITNNCRELINIYKVCDVGSF